MNHYPEYHAGRLDPQAQALLDELARSPSPKTSALTPAQARACFLPAAWQGVSERVAAVHDLPIPGPGGTLCLRVYVPEGEPPFPVLVFFHGGGFVVGALPEFDGFCTRLAAGAHCLVTSVGYRLAPEHRHPAAVEDATAALRWVASHAAELGGDPARMAVAGDSAGANLAAVVALAARDEGIAPLVAQVVVSPWVDLSSGETESFRLFGRGPWLSTDTIDWYRTHYLARTDQSHRPQVSPLLASDLAGLPPALIIDAEFDVLRDQAEAYARRLEQAGNAVEYRRYPGTLHDFAVLPGVFPRAEEAIGDICAALRRAFGASSAADRYSEHEAAAWSGSMPARRCRRAMARPGACSSLTPGPCVMWTARDASGRKAEAAGRGRRCPRPRPMRGLSSGGRPTASRSTRTAASGASAGRAGSCARFSTGDPFLSASRRSPVASLQIDTEGRVWTGRQQGILVFLPEPPDPALARVDRACLLPLRRTQAASVGARSAFPRAARLGCWLD